MPSFTRCVVLLLSLAAAARPSLAQGGGSTLADYEGTYAYHGMAGIALVARDSTLFAVLDYARYPLRRVGLDLFVNAGGDTIPFRRGTDGIISGFVERGVYFARRAGTVDPDVVSAVRATARPPGKDGSLTPYAYATPPELRDGIAVGDVGRAGIDTANIVRLVTRVVDGTYPDVHAVLVYRAGRLVVEEYFYEYDRERPHQMRSATKSVVSALLGIAIDRRLIASDTALVLPLFPYAWYRNADPRKDSLTLRDLVTMRSGLACDDWDKDSPGNESRVYESANWVKFVLDLPIIEEPGTRGRYCSGNVAVAGRIVERATHSALPAFAQANLFTPLGIQPRDVRWDYTLSSPNPTFAQLYLRPRDMLKLGMLFQQQGRWAGRQVISREWIARSTAHWSTVGDQEYGYFWWHQWIDVTTPAGTQRIEMVGASGNGGQKIYLIPSLDAVVVLTGGSYNTTSPATAIMQKELLPALIGAAGKK